MTGLEEQLPIQLDPTLSFVGKKYAAGTELVMMLLSLAALHYEAALKPYY